MRGLCFEQVTVRNCTQNGVTIRGASRVAISGCYFSDNGSVAVPSAQARHNLVLQDVEGCDIKHSRFDTSPGGCGLAFDQSRAIDISNNEFARNALFGVWLTRSQNIRILRNLAEGNDAGGFFLGAPAKGPQEIEVRRNLIRNNGGCGVEISSTIQAVISGNKLMDNACAEQLRVASSERISR
jgi:parallel beta-helix repeat protein